MGAVGLLVLFCLTNAAGVLLLRLSLRGGEAGIGGLVGHLTDPRFLAGAFAYGASFLTWILALQRFRASIVYPVFVGAGYCCVVVGSFMVLGERPTPLQFVGIAIILIGIVFVVSQRAG